MNSQRSLPTSLFLAIGWMLGPFSLLFPWFYFDESGTTFGGQWGFGPVFYSEPVKEDPQTSAGLALQHTMTSSSTNFWIWHDLSFFSAIAVFISALVLLLVGKKALSRILGTYGVYFIPSSLMILSLIAWVQFVHVAVEKACFGSTCLSGLSGQWTDPSGSGTINWGMSIGFFVPIAAAIALVIAGSTAFLNSRADSRRGGEGNPE